MVTLRPYQQQAIDGLRNAVKTGMRRPMLVAPTGSGKTVIAASLIHHAQQKGSQILFVAHRRELIAQTSRKLDDIGADHGIIQAGNHRVNTMPIQVASVQTMNRRASWFTPQIIIIDEAHRATADSYQRIINEFPSAVRSEERRVGKEC